MLSQPVPRQPVIKWPGGKWRVAHVVGAMFRDAPRYFEPFVGGGALLPFRRSQEALAGDIITELVELWKAIRHTPDATADEYETRWDLLQSTGHPAYYAIRESFNTTRNPHDLLFLSRTCVNGLVRFNSNGEFNNSLHHTRPGISPSRLRRIIHQWSQAIQGVEFVAGDYRETLASAGAGDFVFLDPPYSGTKGRYMPDEFGLEDFLGELHRLNHIGAQWVLTFDGRAGGRTYTGRLPSDLYKARLSVATGNSPFPKLMRTGIDAVLESVYLNFEPNPCLLNQVANLGKQRLRIVRGLDMQQGRLLD
jgi:DNA adenine methylase